MAAHETWFEKLMREASEAGEFDDLAGAGKPLPGLDRPYDPAWWAKRWVQREAIAEAARDIAARVRREVPWVLAGADEAAMAASLHSLNAEIAGVNDRLDADDRLPLLDVEGLIADRASGAGS